MSEEGTSPTTGRSTSRKAVVLAAAGGAVLLALAGVTVASAVRHPEPASAGRQVSFEYATVRKPRYTPPPPTEEMRLDVRPAAGLYTHAEVLSPEADATWRDMQAEDAMRMATALAEVRAADRRLDRELAAQLRENRVDDAEEDNAPAAFVRNLDDDEETDDAGEVGRDR